MAVIAVTEGAAEVIATAKQQYISEKEHSDMSLFAGSDV